MKKYFLFAAVAGMLASCSSESLTGSDPNIEPTQEDRVPIEINVASAQTKATTRGSGTVGGTTAGTNAWNGQKVNVFMFNQNSLNLAEDNPGAGDYIYNNTALTTPSDGSASGLAYEYLTASTIKHRYYPQGRNFDFWGYYKDDAAGAAPDATNPVASELVGGDTEVRVPFTINGTQDLMTAKAVPTAAEITALGTRGTDFYSAYAARKNVQPNLTFKHLLTRLTFTVQGGNATACGWKKTGTWSGPAVGDHYNGVFVKSISIKSQNSGYIVAAYTRADMSGDTRYQDPTKMIKFDNTTTAPATDPDNYVPFYLMNPDDDGNGQLDPLYSWTPITATDLIVTAAGPDNYHSIYKPTCSTTDASDDNAFTFDQVKVGDAMLIQPRASYVMEIELGQYLLDVEDITNPLNNTYIVKSSTISDIPVALNSGSFEAGKSYNINVTVWGYEEILITTTLEQWVDGGNVDAEYE